MANRQDIEAIQSAFIAKSDLLSVGIDQEDDVIVDPHQASVRFDYTHVPPQSDSVEMRLRVVHRFDGKVLFDKVFPSMEECRKDPDVIYWKEYAVAERALNKSVFDSSIAGVAKNMMDDIARGMQVPSNYLVGGGAPLPKFKALPMTYRSTDIREIERINLLMGMLDEDE
jgi:hypothetical protein